MTVQPPAAVASSGQPTTLRSAQCVTGFLVMILMLLFTLLNYGSHVGIAPARPAPPVSVGEAMIRRTLHTRTRELLLPSGPTAGGEADELLPSDPRFGSPSLADAAGGAIRGVSDIHKAASTNVTSVDAGALPKFRRDELQAFERRKASAAKFTSRPLYPPSVAAYRHPLGTCDGYREMSDFDYMAAFEADVLQRTGKPARGQPALAEMRRFFLEGRAGNRSRAPFSPPLDTRSPLLSRVPTNVVEAGLVALPYESTYVRNGTRLWEHLMPDAREAPASEHEGCHYVMARMMAVFAAVCERYKLTWFITHGTLLGAVRHGGFIPWDVDVDIVMPRSHMTALRKLWRREFPRDMFLQTEKTEPSFHMYIGKEFGMRVADRYSGFMDVDFTSRGPKGVKYRAKPYHVGAQLDIIPLERKVRGAVLKIFHQYFNRTDVFPLSAVCFENMVVPAPRAPKRFLEKLYGPDYMDVQNNSHAVYPPLFSKPCLAAVSTGRSRWRLSWRQDGRATGNATVALQGKPEHSGPTTPVLFPRDDAGGTFESDNAHPYGA